MRAMPGDAPYRRYHARFTALGGAILVLSLARCALGAAAGPSPAQPSPHPSPQASAQPSSAGAIQPQAAQPLSIPDGSAVIALLDQTIGWYRGLATEVQMVEEPLEVLFVSQDRAQATEVLKLAFEYARAEAAALASLHTIETKAVASPSGDILENPQLIGSRLSSANSEVAAVKQRIAGFERQLAAARGRLRAQVARDLADAQNQLALAQSRADLLATVSQFEGGAEGGNAGGTLLNQIEELEQTLPQPGGGSAPGANLPQLQPAIAPTGLLEQGHAWLQLRQKIDSIERRIRDTDALGDETRQSRSTLQQEMVQLGNAARALAGQAGAEPGESAAAIEVRKSQFAALLDRRKQIAAALLPLSKMSLLLKPYDANLAGWRDEAAQRAIRELRGLITRAIALSIIIAALLAVGMGWRRLASRYVEDRHRRSQMIQLRNVVIGVLIAIVLALEFVSQVGSLATMIGLATAGIAVALQDVIVSIAGYFRIGGRFGIKVGDWIEVQGVRGEVVDIGLTKLTLMELGGEANKREPTGRLAVLPNSVVFREKFASRAYGYSLGWDEIELMVSPDCDYRMVEKRLAEVVDEVFARYRDAARAQSREMERRLNLKIEPPSPQSRIRLSREGIRLSVRYPVDARMSNQVMDEISRRLLDSFKRDPSVRLIPHEPANLQPNPDGGEPAAGQAEQPSPAARASKA